MIGAKKEDAVEFSGGKYISPGIQELKINDIQLEYSSQKNTPRLKFIVESRPVEEKGFTPDDSALSGGKVGTIRTSYLGNDNQLTELANNMIFISRHLGKEDQLDGYYANTLEEYVAKLKTVICNSFAWFKVHGEEYLKQDGKTGLVLSFSRFGFVNADKDKIRDYNDKAPMIKKLTVIPDPEPAGETTDTAPF